MITEEKEAMGVQLGSTPGGGHDGRGEATSAAATNDCVLLLANTRGEGKDALDASSDTTKTFMKMLKKTRNAEEVATYTPFRPTCFHEPHGFTSSSEFTLQFTSFEKAKQRVNYGPQLPREQRFFRYIQPDGTRHRYYNVDKQSLSYQASRMYNR